MGLFREVSFSVFHPWPQTGVLELKGSLLLRPFGILFVLLCCGMLHTFQSHPTDLGGRNEDRRIRALFRSGPPQIRIDGTSHNAIVVSQSTAACHLQSVMSP